MDARERGSLARFVNHSARPNLLAVYAATRPEHLRAPLVAFFAARPIAPGEELTMGREGSQGLHPWWRQGLHPYRRQGQNGSPT